MRRCFSTLASFMEASFVPKKKLVWDVVTTFSVCPDLVFRVIVEPWVFWIWPQTSSAEPEANFSKKTRR